MDERAKPDAWRRYSSDWQLLKMYTEKLEKYPVLTKALTRSDFVEGIEYVPYSKFFGCFITVDAV